MVSQGRSGKGVGKALRYYIDVRGWTDGIERDQAG